MSLAQFAVAGAALTLVLAVDQLAKAGAERILPEAPRPAASPSPFREVFEWPSARWPPRRG